jgi:integrase
MPDTCGEWIEALRYRIVHLKGTKPESWTGDYWKVLKRLPMDEPLTPAMLEEVIGSTQPNTKTRKRACMAIGALAELAKVDYDPSPFAGKYGLNSIHPRDLVGDELIVQQWSQLKNSGWRWVFGMVAAYGLRPHEAFRLNFEALKDGDRVVQVEANSKTGERLVWAFHPEWFEQFSLDAVALPKVDTSRSNEKVGHSATEYFGKTARLPFTLYTMRHCWAVRAMLYGLPDTLAAQQMGHSVEVHQRLYQRWVNRSHHQAVYELLIGRGDRPRPPLGEE